MTAKIENGKGRDGESKGRSGRPAKAAPGKAAPKGLGPEMKSLLQYVHFIEQVSASIHGVLDEEEIYEILKQEFIRSRRYDMSVLLLTGDGERLRIKQTSLTSGKMKAAEKLTGLNQEKFSLNLNSSEILRRVVREGETIHASALEMAGQMLTSKLAKPIMTLIGYENLLSVATPLRCGRETIGALAMSSLDLSGYFIPSVISFAQHIGSALALAHEYVESRRMEAALKESEEKYRAIFEHSRDGINLAEFDFATGRKRLVEMNREYVEQAGYGREQLLRGNIYNKQTSAYSKEEVAEQDKAWAKGETVRGHFSWKRPDGKKNHIEFTSVPIRIGDRQYILGIDRDVTDWKLVENALRASERRFRELTQQLPEILVEIDTRGNILFANEIAFAKTGYSPDEIKSGLNIIDLVVTEDRQRIRSNFTKSLKGEKLGLTEYTVRIKNGKTLPVAIHSVSILNDSGKPVGLRAIVIDITERKRMEEALGESEEKYRNLVERANDGIGIIQDGLVKYVNPSLADIVGYTPDELRDTDVFQHVHPDNRDEVLSSYERRMKGAPVKSVYETIVKHKSGRPVHVEVNAGIVNYQGRPADMVLIRDIGERKRAEEALSRSEEKYRLLAENVTDVIFTIDLAMNFIYVSQSVTNLLGYAARTLIGKPVRQVMTPASFRRAAAVLREELEKDTGKEAEPSRSRTLEIELKHRNGSRLIAETRVSFIRDSDGAAVGILGVARDVTTRKQAEEELRVERDKAQHYLDIAGVIILALNAKGEITLINRKGCEVLGCEEEELIGKNWFADFIPARMAGGLKTVFRNLMEGRGEGKQYYENPVLTKDGRERIIAWHNTVIRDRKGKTLETLSSGEDITERIQAVEALRASEIKLRNIVEYSLDGIVLCDEEWRVIEWNSGQENISGVERDRVLGHTLWDVFQKVSTGKIPRPRMEEIKSEMQKFSRTGKADWLYRLLDQEIRRPDGGSRNIQALVFPIKTDKGFMACGISRDVTDTKETEKEMKVKDSALQGSINAVAFADLAGKITYVNPTFLNMWGYSSEQELLGRPIVEVWQAEEKALRVMETVSREGGWMGELVAKRKDSSFFDVQLSSNLVKDESERPICMMASFIDITERKKYEENLLRAAIYDSLTGVFNRRHLMERLESIVRSALRHRYPVSLCLCDIDNFKAINDLYGHRAGDDVLARFGRIVRDELRLEDVVGRYGGDEFCMVFPHTKSSAAVISIERIRTRLEEVIFRNSANETFSITGTFGVAELSAGDKDEKTLLDTADQALYRAKNLGRNRVVVKKE